MSEHDLLRLLGQAEAWPSSKGLERGEDSRRRPNERMKRRDWKEGEKHERKRRGAHPSCEGNPHHASLARLRSSTQRSQSPNAPPCAAPCPRARPEDEKHRDPRRTEPLFCSLTASLTAADELFPSSPSRLPAQASRPREPERPARRSDRKSAGFLGGDEENGSHSERERVPPVRSHRASRGRNATGVIACANTKRRTRCAPSAPLPRPPCRSGDARAPPRATAGEWRKRPVRLRRLNQIANDWSVLAAVPGQAGKRPLDDRPDNLARSDPDRAPRVTHRPTARQPVVFFVVCLSRATHERPALAARSLNEQNSPAPSGAGDPFDRAQSCAVPERRGERDQAVVSRKHAGFRRHQTGSFDGSGRASSKPPSPSQARRDTAILREHSPADPVHSSRERRPPARVDERTASSPLAVRDPRQAPAQPHARQGDWDLDPARRARCRSEYLRVRAPDWPAWGRRVRGGCLCARSRAKGRVGRWLDAVERAGLGRSVAAAVRPRQRRVCGRKARGEGALVSRKVKTATARTDIARATTTPSTAS